MILSAYAVANFLKFTNFSKNLILYQNAKKIETTMCFQNLNNKE